MKNLNRRNFLKLTGALVAFSGIGSLLPSLSLAERPASVFSEADLQKSIMGAFGTDKVTASSDVFIDAPEIAENGNAVSITFGSNNPNIRKVALFVAKNPRTLSGIYQFSEGTEPQVSTRIRLAKTSDLIVIGQDADGNLVSAKKEVKVTIGGCGG